MTDKPPIRFAFNSHGLGDVCHAAQALRLYIDRGYNVQIQVEPNKRWIWDTAGIPIYDGPDALPIHPYYYLPSMQAFWDLSLPDHSSSKIAGFFDVDELPKLDTKEQVWQRLCDERIDARPSVTPQAVADVTAFLKDLPKPIILLHSKGTNWQVEKSIPDATCFQFLCDLIGSFDGSIIVLDWDRRAPTLGHERIRSICPHWPHMSLDQFGALCMQSDLMIGVDSGPFHLAQWFDIPTLFVTRKIPPVRCCLPHPNATYLVPASEHDHWATRGPEWHFAEFHGQEATSKDLVIMACEMLAVHATPTKATAMQTIDAASVPGKYIYHRVGHDQRQMELLPDGRIGEGAAGCERVWKIEQSPVGPVVTIIGEHGGATCHLKLEADGILRGRWLNHERMPIELIRDERYSPMKPETVTFADLIPIEDEEPLKIIDYRPQSGHPTDRLPDAEPNFYFGLLTYNRFDLLELAIEAALASTILPRKIYVIDNSGGKWQGHASRRIEVIRPPYNLGVSRGFNVLQSLCQPSPLIVGSDDTEVSPDLFEKMLAHPTSIVYGHGAFAFTVHLIRSDAWNKVGPWDSEFYPAYHEDNDYARRAELAGVTTGCPLSDGFIDHGPSATKAAMSPAERSALDGWFDKGRARYVAKWGGPPHLETFVVPFNGVPQ